MFFMIQVRVIVLDDVAVVESSLTILAQGTLLTLFCCQERIGPL